MTIRLDLGIPNTDTLQRTTTNMIHPDFYKSRRIVYLIAWLKLNNYSGAQCFFHKNKDGDPTYTVYDRDGIVVRACGYLDYIEVLGLNKEEQDCLCREGEDLEL